MPRLGGGIEGFSVDLFNGVARRMGRPLSMDSAGFAGLIPAMNAGRHDFLRAPTTATAQRAENMLCTEGHLFTAFQFGIRRGSAPLTSLDDLRGRAIGVNKGSAYDTRAQANAARYGFTVQAWDTSTDAVQAVPSGRACANLAGNTVVTFAATRTPRLVPDLLLKDPRAHCAAPFPIRSVALRNEVDRVIGCIRKDGFIARLSERRFGAKPGADDAGNVVFPGSGVPRLPGRDPTPHTAPC